jgi:hypothetical protein
LQGVGQAQQDRTRSCSAKQHRAFGTVRAGSIPDLLRMFRLKAGAVVAVGEVHRAILLISNVTRTVACGSLTSRLMISSAMSTNRSLAMAVFTSTVPMNTCDSGCAL